MPVAQQFIDDTASEEGIKALVDLRPWMKHKRMEIIDSIPALDKFIDEACEAKRCSVDLETDGLNTGPHERGKGARVAQPAGFCLSYHRDYGVYIPVGHKEGRNLPLPAVVSRIKRLVSECTTIYHNFKFDGELLRNMGVIIEDPKKYEDTLLMADEGP
jgi:DNA polymerase I-like protein with 3'-5' exonuclease and polymerase domains